VTSGRCPRCGALDLARRRDAYAHGFEDGRTRGILEAAELRAEVGVPPELADMWPALVKLVHPDVHALARREQAEEVTRALLEWRSRIHERTGSRGR
jgi:hypothetical protein